MIATCIACGCDDFHACQDSASGHACHWLAVDYGAGVGVCSCCPDTLIRWNAGDRSERMLVAKIAKDGSTAAFFVEKNDLGSIPYHFPIAAGDRYLVEWVEMTTTEFENLPQFEHFRLAEKWQSEIESAKNAASPGIALRHKANASLIERRVTALGYDVRFLAEQIC